MCPMSVNPALCGHTIRNLKGPENTQDTGLGIEACLRFQEIGSLRTLNSLTSLLSRPEHYLEVERACTPTVAAARWRDTNNSKQGYLQAAGVSLPNPLCVMCQCFRGSYVETVSGQVI